ncbi:MAG: hypothetical protein CVT89_02615 [Candidatus Altiarchaeales archaeon HGW-Altiarchaeales-2]|nr:MAG: hypothetical protein CVT89_02615 [Candidatus Altiarchaeales archaeon HGW-Altiarchaeales-2]
MGLPNIFKRFAEVIDIVKEAKKVNDPALIQGLAANYNARQWQKNNYTALKNNIVQAKIDIENKIATLAVIKEFGVMNKELGKIEVPELSEKKIDNTLNGVENTKDKLDEQTRQTQGLMEDIFSTTAKSGIELDKETTLNFMDMVALPEEEVIKKVRETSFAK